MHNTLRVRSLFRAVGKSAWVGLKGAKAAASHPPPGPLPWPAAYRPRPQMFDCSDMCDCAWGGSDIVQCMMCNSKCTRKKCADYCAKLAAGGRKRPPLSAASMSGMFGGGGG